MLAVAETIKLHRDEIVRAWRTEAQRAASARGASTPELGDVMPEYLDALAQGSTETARARLEPLLDARIRQGAKLPEIVEELVALSECILAAGSSETVSLALLFNDDDLHEYARLIEALADGTAGDLDASLQSRLEPIVELLMKAAAAESATLLVFEPGAQSPIATVSSGSQRNEIEAFATANGAKLGAGDNPLSELEVTSRLRQSGIHCLFGVALSKAQTVVGKLYFARSKAGSLSTQQAATLQDLVEKLTLRLDNARLSARLRRRTEELDSERKLRDQFIAILAHDLRGPLSTARMSSQMLVRYADKPETRLDLAGKIERNLERLDRMIRDLSDVSRVRAGDTMPLRLDLCDLKTVAEEVVTELCESNGKRYQIIAQGTVRGVWSHDELRRALWNLCTNAAKYGAPDKPITIEIRWVENQARLSVHNLGSVIPPEEIPNLFDLYARAKNPNGVTTGWGLGLALVRACAQAHGGSVSVESSQETGTTFTIQLPPDSRKFQKQIG